MIQDKFKRLLLFTLVASACLFAKPAYASESDSDSGYWFDMAVFLGSWAGTTTGAVNDYLDVRMGVPILLYFELQFSRVALGFYYGFGLIHSFPYLYDEGGLTEYDRDNEESDESLGLTFGYAVFTSRYLELQPFIGCGGNIFNNGLDDKDFSTFILGGNIDIRMESKHVKSTDVAFELGLMLRLKYIAEFGSFSDKHKDVEYEDYYINHIFSISIGIAIW